MLGQGEEEAVEAGSRTLESPIRPKPKKTDGEATVELLAKVVDEVKLDQKLPNPGERTFISAWTVAVLSSLCPLSSYQCRH